LELQGLEIGGAAQERVPHAVDGREVGVGSVAREAHGLVERDRQRHVADGERRARRASRGEERERRHAPVGAVAERCDDAGVG